MGPAGRLGGAQGDGNKAELVCVQRLSCISTQTTIPYKAATMMSCFSCSVIQLRPALCDPMDCSLPGSSIHWIFQAKYTGVGCHFPLQEIFLTQGSNLLPKQANA